MKIKSFVTFSLLLAISFSIVHEYAFAFYDEHCNVTAYVEELQGSAVCTTVTGESCICDDDMCDIHFEYHQAFLLLSESALFQVYNLRSDIILTKESYQFQTHLKFIKPPIA
jgi:hypothetical protein